MQALIFQNIFKDNVDWNIWNWSEKSLKELNEEFDQKGRVILLQKSSFEKLESFFQGTDNVNCGIKNKEIDLYRSLKLHWKKNKFSLRRLITNYPNLAAAKRSIFRFFKRYMPKDPPCILFIPDEVFSEAIDTLDIKPVKKLSNDPITSLISEVENKPTVREIKEVFLGESPEAKLTRAMIYKASLSESPVLILGESGTGKDIIARQIFKYSKNNRKTFISLNCSAFQETLLESELFGHKKGSFTGATEDKEGLFIVADGGTLFLDEIGDLSFQNQTKILHAIENKEIRPIGSTKSITVDVRIIAATNRNLAQMMKQKTFRDDLYFRLNTFTINSFPLRNHPEDISVIAQKVWSLLNNSQPLSDIFINHLKEYPWPGNVRELNTLLTNIYDMFGPISPKIDDIEAIRTFRNEDLRQSQNASEDELDRMLLTECKNRLIKVQIIMRNIKIAVRPIIHESLNKNEKRNLRDFKNLVAVEIVKLEDICREPIYMGNKELFKKITRFRYLLEKKIENMPKTTESINIYWRSKVSPLYDQIDEEIYEIVFGKSNPQIPESNNTN